MDTSCFVFTFVSFLYCTLNVSVSHSQKVKIFIENKSDFRIKKKIINCENFFN